MFNKSSPYAKVHYPIFYTIHLFSETIPSGTIFHLFYGPLAKMVGILSRLYKSWKCMQIYSLCRAIVLDHFFSFNVWVIFSHLISISGQETLLETWHKTTPFSIYILFVFLCMPRTIKCFDWFLCWKYKHAQRWLPDTYSYIINLKCFCVKQKQFYHVVKMK